MSETIARPIVNGKFWVLKQNEKKIGSVEKDNNGYFVTTQQGNARFKTIKSLRDITKIAFLLFFQFLSYNNQQHTNCVISFLWCKLANVCGYCTHH